MYEIQLYELEKPRDEYDNGAVEAGGCDVSTTEELLAEVKSYLPTLGGTHARWLEISKKEDE